MAKNRAHWGLVTRSVGDFCFLLAGLSQIGVGRKDHALGFEFELGQQTERLVEYSYVRTSGPVRTESTSLLVSRVRMIVHTRSC